MKAPLEYYASTRLGRTKNRQ